MSRMSEEEILTVLQGYRAAAKGEGDTIEEDRDRAFDYLYGDPLRGCLARDLPPEAGQSSAVSTDVSDAIETILPDLMEIFTGGDNVVAFAPQGPEDEAAAEQETDYVNYVFYNENPGWMTLYAHIKDALTSKTGVFKWWWEEREESETFVFENKTEDEYRIIRDAIRKGEVEFFDDEEPEPHPETGLYTFRARRTTKRAGAKVAAVAPEDFRVDVGATCIADASWAGNASRPTKADLLRQDFDRAKVMELHAASYEQDSRSPNDEGFEQHLAHQHELSERVEIFEHHVWLDIDGKGLPQCWKIITGNDETVILDREEIDAIQYAVNCPYPVTHRFYGRSLADLLVEIQKIKTALLRQMLNLYYFSASPRPIVAMSRADRYTISDLLQNKPGRPIRVKEDGAIKWETPPVTGEAVLPALEYMSTLGEQRAGVVRNAQGLNPDTLHDTARGAMELMNAAQRRVRMIARIFAETGIRDLFIGLHDLIVKHARQEATVRLRGKWVEIDPNKWNRRKDLSIEVGLGSNTKSAELAFWQNILAIQREAMAAGLADETNIFNALKKFMQAGNIRNADLYFQNPADRPEGEEQQQPAPDPDMAKVQGELQLKARQQQAEMQLEARKVEFEAQLALYKMQVEQGLAEQAAATEARLAEFKVAADARNKAAQTAAKVEMDRISNVRFGGQVG